MCYMCSIGSPPTKNFRLCHCFGPAYLLDLLHNPKCTGSSFSLNSPIYLPGNSVVSWSSFFFPSATKRNYAFSEVVPRGRLPKISIFRPPLVRMWLTPPSGRLHLALDTTLSSCSVKLV